MTRAYRALTLLWHTGAGVYVHPGEQVDLSHLTPEEIEQLVELGAVERATPNQRTQKEVSDGTTGSSDQSA